MNASPASTSLLSWFTARRTLPLAVCGVLMVVALVGTLIGLVVDQRVITGAPAWLKPAKFAMSLTIYAFTIVWLLTYIKGHDRLVWWTATVTALVSIIEFVIIAAQVVRNTTSHFNATTPLDDALFSVMGISIVTLWIMGIIIAVLLLRQRSDNGPFMLALRLGLVISLIGMIIAFLMTGANPAQARAAREVNLASGGITKITGSHGVGVPDGGPGLPIVGWSTEGGDLRAPHFVGIHALQVLPLLAFLAALAGLSVAQQRRIVWGSGIWFLGLVVLLTWQALRGQSIIAPDSQTLLSFAGLTLVALGTALFVPTASTSRQLEGRV